MMKILPTPLPGHLLYERPRNSGIILNVAKGENVESTGL
jgi:hypothetical protein